MKVFVYRNLHRKCYSVKALEGPFKGRVVAWVHELTLWDCELKVSEAGRQRVLKEKKKNVHAGIVGYVANIPYGLEKPYWGRFLETQVRDLGDDGHVFTLQYNPYKLDGFALNGQPGFEVTHAAMVTVGKGSFRACGLKFR